MTEQLNFHFIEPVHTIVGTDDVEAVRTVQEIPQEFLDKCAQERFASSHGPMGDYHKFASIPVAVVDQWMKDGFDVYREPLKAIVARLKKENLDAFLTSNRSL